ncbi:MAG: hypothetical protein GY942_13360 [Aestuariibacter sp.]|nr:hypothetical protein [Aestuariibacter sp.]
MDTPKAPKQLSREAKQWWRKFQEEYGVEDEAGLLLMQTALEAFDRMKEAQKVIAEDGLMIKDRFDQLKAHPLLTTERDSRAQMLTALKSLNFDLEPLRDAPGRPGGS